MSTSARLAVLLATVFAAGCGSSPPSTFFALAPTDGAVHPGAPHAIRIRRPGIPGYLDRPEIVRRIVDYRLGIQSYERWGEPIDEMLARVIAQDIEQRSPGSVAFTEEGAITAAPDATVEVDVRRFDVGAKGDVTLVADVAIERGEGHTQSASRAFTLNATPKDGSTPALVATMSVLLGQLADQITVMLHGGSEPTG